ncbi:MAG: hypothetical protein LC104_06895, partial [Bacteroidales bacterium]|nr:hypothetical protein [Bacteroidales bacterium]
DPHRRTAQNQECLTLLHQTVQRLEWLIDWSAEAVSLRRARERLRLTVTPPEAADHPDTTPARQRDRLRTVTAIVQETSLLIAALQEQQQRELGQYAHRLQRLAQEQQQLEAVITRNRIAWQQQCLTATVEQQQALIAESLRWATRMAVPLQIAGVAAFDPTAFQTAEKRLQQRRLPDALIEQEKAARELDRIAVALRKAAEARQDSRETIRQLMLWQSNIRTRFLDRELADVHQQAEFRQDEQILLRLLEQIVIPHADQKLTTLHAEAVQATRHAVETLTSSPADAEAALTQAEAALRTLSERFPTREERLRITRQQWERFLRDYRLLTGTVERATREAELTTHAATLAASFQALTRQIQELDLPGLEPRRAAIMFGLQRLAQDVQAGHRSDIGVSLRRLQWECDWLRQAVSGATPDDDQARALLRLQQQFQKAVESASAPPEAPGRQAARVTAGELLRQYQAFSALPVLPLLEDVRESARQTVRAAQSASAEELLSTVRTTTNLMSQLVSRLTGAESDRDRVRECAERAEAAAQRERFAPRLPPTAQEMNAAQLELRTFRSLLEGTRTGPATTAREAVERALTRLQEADRHERHPALYQTLSVAVQRLTEAMKSHPVPPSPSPSPLSHPSSQSCPSDFAATAPEETLPQQSSAKFAMQLAERQRAIRDQVSALQARFAFGLTPSDRDPFGERLAAFVSFQQTLHPNSDLFHKVELLREQMRRGDPALWQTMAQIRQQFPKNPSWERDGAALTEGLPTAEAGFTALAARQSRYQEEIRTAIQQLAQTLTERAALPLPGLEPTATIQIRCAEQLQELDATMRRQEIGMVVFRCREIADQMQKTQAKRPSSRFPLTDSVERLVQAIITIRASVRPALPPHEQEDLARQSLQVLTAATQALRSTLQTPIGWER